MHEQTDPGLNLTTERTRKREFLAQTERVVPWAALVELMAPYAPEGKKGRPLGQLPARREHLRHLLERHKLADQILALVNDLLVGKGLLPKAGTVVDATLITAPSSTKNKDGQRDPEMHPVEEGQPMVLRHDKRRALDKANEIDTLVEQIEKLKASVRAKVEHPFKVIKRQSGHVKVRDRRLKKNTAQMVTLFALSNLWMVRSKLLAAWT